MALTPADIHNTEFAKASLGRRGYDLDDVDALLDEATGEMIRLLEENDALRSRLGADVPARDELSAATAALDRAHQACDRAERAARHVRQQLDEAVTDVRRGRSTDRVLARARHTADAYLGEARDESRALVTDAHDRADRTLREARDAVAAIDRQSRDQQKEAAADLESGRARLTRDIDDLTRYAASYHGALERHLHSFTDGEPGQ